MNIYFIYYFLFLFMSFVCAYAYQYLSKWNRHIHKYMSRRRKTWIQEMVMFLHIRRQPKIELAPKQLRSMHTNAYVQYIGVRIQAKCVYIAQMHLYRLVIVATSFLWPQKNFSFLFSKFSSQEYPFVPLLCMYVTKVIYGHNSVHMFVCH